jgi:hypothetical protein
MKPTLHVCTVCSRPQNLPALAASINLLNEGFDLHWHIRFQFGAHACQVGCNAILDSITSGWVWFLDDDNMPYQNFFDTLARLIAEQPGVRAWIFGQLREGRTITAHPAMVRENQIDVAQFCLQRDLIGDRRFAMKYSADGEFIETLFRDHPEAFGFHSGVLAYYNYLRP